MARAVVLFPAATAILALIFVSVPQIDIAVSALFGDENGFPLSRSPILKAARTAMILLTDGIMAMALVALLVQGSFRRVRLFDQRKLAFAVTSYVVGPGLMVGGFLKGFFGRARPNQTDIFGGEGSFSPAFVISDECQRYCSFVSGEATALATVAAILFFLFVRRLPEHERLFPTIVILGVVLFGSALRVAFGAHFLSDVLFAWILSIAVVAWMYAAFEIEPSAHHLPQRNKIALRGSETENEVLQ